MFIFLVALLLASSRANADGEFLRRRLVSYAAAMSTYPDYSGSYTSTGDVVVQEESEGSTSVTVTYDLAGFEASTSGGIHVHVGTSCADADFVGGHYYDDSLSDDPSTIEWTSDSLGEASGVLTVDAGILIDDDYGHALVVHNSDSTLSACGLLGSTEYTVDLGLYLDYDGNFSVIGIAAVSETIGVEVLINNELFGLEADASCGNHIHSGALLVNFLLDGQETDTSLVIHIHSGTTCLVADLVSGHFYDSDALSINPWTTTYTSDEDGSSSGSFNIDSGYDTIAEI